LRSARSIASQISLRAASSVGMCPRVLMILRIWRLSASIVLVVDRVGEAGQAVDAADQDVGDAAPLEVGQECSQNLALGLLNPDPPIGRAAC
jgi:hypothetical protein